MCRRPFIALLLVGLSVLCIASSLADELASSRATAPLRVLFLGDQGPHRPAERARQMIPIMAARGIQIDYTENLADLAANRLAAYAALVIYANIDRIEPAQEQALLDYVAGGGGFVPLPRFVFAIHRAMWL